MKEYLFFFLLLLIPYYSLSATSGYDYSSYSASSTNENLSSSSITNTNSDSSAVYITKSGITITESSITKSGDTSGNVEDCEFYGVNAAVLVNGGGLTMTGGTISTSAKGGNALVATNSGIVTISKTTITSTGPSSARGLHSTYGGSITASEVTITTSGGSCATLATDRGEGTVTCTGCTLTTSGSGSPLIYSTGDITVSGTTGTSNKAQAVVVEGKNSATINSSSNLKCTASPNNKNDQCGILIYQSMSGDADSGTSTFTCESSSIEILSSSDYYSSAPMFFITNTATNIILNSCTFTYGSNTFLKADEGDWGESGSNGGTVTLTLTNQNIEGDIIVGSTSSLTINLVKSSIKGTINGDKTAAKLAIVLDSDSTITLTGNSYYTSLTNSDSSNSNIISGSYTWTSYDETSSSSGQTSSSSTRTRPDKPDDSTSSSSSTSTTSTTSNSENDDDEDIDPIETSATNLNYLNILLVFIISALFI